MALWSVWLSGFLLIGLSLYSTNRLPSFKDHINKARKLQRFYYSDSNSPTITIFSAARPFNGSVGARQLLAVRSWLALSPYLTVVLFSRDPSVLSFSAAFNSRLSVEPRIDFTFLGTPFFHSMVAKIQTSVSDISVLIDPQTILFPNFISTLNSAHKFHYDWLLISSPRCISYFPFHLDDSGVHWLRENGKRIKTRKLQEIVARGWQKDNHCEERMIMAWNKGNSPLHNGVLPPFLYGKGTHNHWFINEALSSDFRFIFDASGIVSSLHLDDLGCQSNRSESWEQVGNSLLGSVYGTFDFRQINYSKLVKLLSCNGQYLFIDTKENSVLPFGYQRPLRFWRVQKVKDCVNWIRSLESVKYCSCSDEMKLLLPLHLPFSLESLLTMVADENNSVVLSVVGYNYKDMLMSWVCRLRHLHVQNFVVCALDHEVYEFCILQGLPVFKDSLAPRNITFNDCHFGTECFQRVTKVKSRIALQILNLGYNVLLSDVDVYWFRNPLPMLSSFGPSVLVAQSDEYVETGPINLPRRLNSGFYFAHSDTSTISAMAKVVKHASTSNLSEQPSFYDTLCGEGGIYRVGVNRCLEPETNLTVHFLDRDLFPNGAYRGLWERKDVKEACLKNGCLILHNNWINGRRKKLERQVSSGLWDYDASTRMCLLS